MKPTIPNVLALIAIFSIAAPAAADDLKSKSTVNSPAAPQKPVTLAATQAAEEKLLQGKWEGVEMGNEGHGTCALTIAGTKIAFEGSEKEEWYRATFTVTASKEPKQLEVTITDCAVPELVGKTSTAIYKIEQGKLTIAAFKPGSGKTPERFESDGGVRSFVFSKAAEAPK